MSNLTPTLPPNATPLQRAIVQACAPLGDIPVPIRDVWNVDTCPPELLPHLAWSLSVDRWDENWSLETKRAVIKASCFIHRHKGTVAAVRRVVESLGYVIRIVQWWEMDPPGPRGTFLIDVGVRDSGITEETYQEMERLIADAKPESRHLTGLSIQLETKGSIPIGIATHDGDELTVYPWLAEDIETQGTLLQAGTAHLIDTMTVYP